MGKLSKISTRFFSNEDDAASLHYKTKNSLDNKKEAIIFQNISIDENNEGIDDSNQYYTEDTAVDPQNPDDPDNNLESNAEETSYNNSQQGELPSKIDKNNKIQFAMGLNSISNNTFELLETNSFPTDNYSSVSSSSNNTNDNSPVTNSDDNISIDTESTSNNLDTFVEGIDLDENNCSKDKSLQVTYLAPTPFMSAPITYNNSHYSMCFHKIGNTTVDINNRSNGKILPGQVACPDVWSNDILDAIGNNTSLFKVGCAIDVYNNFPNYMEKFYGIHPLVINEQEDTDEKKEAKKKKSREYWSHMAIQLIGNYLNAEMIIPTSGKKCKAVDIKIVEITHNKKDEIYIMLPFMLLKSNKDLWTVKGCIDSARSSI